MLPAELWFPMAQLLEVESVPALQTPLTIQGNGRGGTNGALYLFNSSGVAANVTMAGDSAVRVDLGAG